MLFSFPGAVLHVSLATIGFITKITQDFANLTLNIGEIRWYVTMGWGGVGWGVTRALKKTTVALYACIKLMDLKCHEYRLLILPMKVISKATM